MCTGLTALSDPRLSSPATRASLGEEFKLLFVTIHAGWQAAQREGTVPAFADGVAQLFRSSNGVDLRTARLGVGGFQQG